MSKIEITADEAVVHEVSLVGKDYEVGNIKAALAMDISSKFSSKGKTKSDVKTITEQADAVIDMIFGKKVGDTIRKRLLDPTDRLDLDHIFTLMNKLVEAQSGNPTT